MNQQTAAGLLANGTCEVCGAPARVLVNDLAEAEPVLDPETGELWSNCRVVGTSLLCLAHDRDPVFTPLPS